MIDVIIGENEIPHNQKNQESSPPPDPSSTKEKQGDPNRFTAGTLFCFALILYIFLAMISIDTKYVDFGDGNYLYLSWRLTEGDVLYKDLPNPQPPLLIFLGALFLDLLNGDPTLVRIWQIVQHALIACCVWGIASQLFKRSLFSSVSACIYLFLPEGVWWAAGYQSEPLLILLQCFNLLLFLRVVRQDSPSWMIYLVALISVLCCYTNMTAVPYVALQWFFIWFRFRHFFLRYSLALIVPGVIFFIFMWAYSEGQYLEHVFFRQVGSYPTDSILGTLSYFIGKIYSEGGDILFFEGGFVFASLAGLLLYFANDRTDPVDDYILWWALYSLATIAYATKGGTVEYIFTLGEPAVAIFSAYFLLTLFAASDISFDRRLFFSPHSLGKCILVLCFVIPVLMMKPFSLLFRTFSNGPLVIPQVLKEQGVFELSSEEVDKACLYIQRNCPPNKTMISPPYFAFLTKRKLAENSSELFILSLAYFSDCERLLRSRKLPFSLPDRSKVQMWFEKSERTPAGLQSQIQYDNEGTYYNTQSIFDLAALFEKEPDLKKEYPAIALFLNLRSQIMNKDVGFIVKNMRHFFFYIPPLHQAIRDYCTLVEPQLELNNREEHLVFYRPKS